MKNVLLVLAMAACGLAQDPPAAPARQPGLYATIETTQGAITALLYEKDAPETVKSFVALSKGTKEWKDPETGQMVKKPLYPGTIFHRVVPEFMIQGGDPAGTGTGDPGFTVPDEFTEKLKFDGAGRLAMANTGPNTSQSQFFISEVPLEYLNGKHTIFGQVVEGQDVVFKIARVPRDENDVPKTPVKIASITFKREGDAPANAPEK